MNTLGDRAAGAFADLAVPPQNPVDRTIVDVSALGIKLTYLMLRLLYALFCRLWPDWQNALILVKSETVIGWHRKGFKLY